jgi:D-alanyl-D-alanine dipeptidase
MTELDLLSPVSEDVFAFPNYNMYHGERITFARDDNGQITGLYLTDIFFPKRLADIETGKTFTIVPQLPIEELREIAEKASPPAESGKQAPDLVSLRDVHPGIKYDIRYATTNNFMQTPFYNSPGAFLQRPAAEALGRVEQELEKKGYGLLIHDAYRPWKVTKMFWDATPEKWKDFVANPENGSRHNRGCAVDLALYDLKTGAVIETVGGYDEFSDRSFPHYPGGTERQRYYRELLREHMEAEGFEVYQWEWWHFDFKDWNKYPILDLSFEQLAL